MSSPDLIPVVEAFSPDCKNWPGYKPCDIQKTQQAPDCSGCESYERVGNILTIQRPPYEPSDIQNSDHIGIIEMGGLGSILRTSAVSQAVQAINPGARITWFTHERGATLLQYIPGVEAVTVNECELEPSIDSPQIDLLINFESSQMASKIASKARRIAGFAVNGHGKFYPARHAERLQRIQIDDDYRKNNGQTMQKILLESIGLYDINPKYDLALTNTNYANARLLLSGFFDKKTPDLLVGVNIGTSKNGEPRRWPVASFTRLASRLATTYPEKGIVVLSGPDDTDTLERFYQTIGTLPTNIAVLPNNLEIGDFMATVGLMEILITSNSFALHAARAQETPFVTFEGPLPPAEIETGPFDAILTSDLFCRPCYGRCVRELVGECVQLVSVDQVVDQVASTLLKTRATTLIYNLPAQRLSS